MVYYCMYLTMQFLLPHYRWATHAVIFLLFVRELGGETVGTTLDLPNFQTKADERARSRSRWQHPEIDPESAASNSIRIHERIWKLVGAQKGLRTFLH
jgi:hypothetical protein